MLAIERKNEILGRLRNEKRVLVSELAEYYNVTEETIRRDLDKLEKEGYATKTYGGAILGNSTKTDLSYAVRNKANVEAKKIIANLVCDLIEDGDHLMIDHSSTCYFSVKKLKEKKNLTVITNSVELASEICSIESWNVYMPGGQLRPESMASPARPAMRSCTRIMSTKRSSPARASTWKPPSPTRTTCTPKSSTRWFVRQSSRSSW